MFSSSPTCPNTWPFTCCCTSCFCGFQQLQLDEEELSNFSRRRAAPAWLLFCWSCGRVPGGRSASRDTPPSHWTSSALSVSGSCSSGRVSRVLGEPWRCPGCAAPGGGLLGGGTDRLQRRVQSRLVGGGQLQLRVRRQAQLPRNSFTLPKAMVLAPPSTSPAASGCPEPDQLDAAGVVREARHQPPVAIFPTVRRSPTPRNARSAGPARLPVRYGSGCGSTTAIWEGQCNSSVAEGGDAQLASQHLAPGENKPTPFRNYTACPREHAAGTAETANKAPHPTCSTSRFSPSRNTSGAQARAGSTSTVKPASRRRHRGSRGRRCARGRTARNNRCRSGSRSRWGPRRSARERDRRAPPAGRCHGLQHAVQLTRGPGGRRSHAPARARTAPGRRPHRAAPAR